MFLPKIPQFYESKQGGYYPVLWADNQAIDGAAYPWERATIGSLYVLETNGQLYRKTADNGNTADWTEAGSGSTALADLTDFTDTTGVGTDGYAVTWDDSAGKFVLTEMTGGVGLADDNTWTGLNTFNKNPVASWFDVPIVSAQGNDFNDNTSGAPTGWTQIGAPTTTNTTDRLGFWYLRESGGGLGWSFSKQTTFDDTDFPSWFSATFGPIMWRDGGYTADADWYFGIHANNGGSASATDYITANLNWDSTNSIFRVRGQYSIGGTVTNGSWNNLSFPLPQPLYFRVTGRMDNGESDRQRVYVGTTPIADSHSQILSATLAHGDFDNFHVVVEHDKTSSPESYTYIGGLDFSNAP